MTEVAFTRDASGAPTGFSVKGHAGKMLELGDPLCAAVSAMTMLVCNTLTEVFGVKLAVEAREDKGTFTARIISVADENFEAMCGILEGFSLQIADLSAQNPANIRLIKSFSRRERKEESND